MFLIKIKCKIMNFNFQEILPTNFFSGPSSVVIPQELYRAPYSEPNQEIIQQLPNKLEEYKKMIEDFNTTVIRIFNEFKKNPKTKEITLTIDDIAHKININNYECLTKMFSNHARLCNKVYSDYMKFYNEYSSSWRVVNGIGEGPAVLIENIDDALSTPPIIDNKPIVKINSYNQLQIIDDEHPTESKKQVKYNYNLKIFALKLTLAIVTVACLMLIATLTTNLSSLPILCGIFAGLSASAKTGIIVSAGAVAVESAVVVMRPQLNSNVCGFFSCGSGKNGENGENSKDHILK